MNSFVLDVKWYEAFSKIYIQEYDFGWYFEEEEKEKKRIEFMKKAMNIHNKSIFDSLNESLDAFRPYGVIGEPYPWKSRPCNAPGLDNNLQVILL